MLEVSEAIEGQQCSTAVRQAAFCKVSAFALGRFLIFPCATNLQFYFLPFSKVQPTLSTFSFYFNETAGPLHSAFVRFATGCLR